MGKIYIQEKVLSGNFCQSDYENGLLAQNYVNKITRFISDFCCDEYPSFDLEMSFDIDHASGSGGGVTVYVYSDALDTHEIQAIENEIVSKIEREQLEIMRDQWQDLDI